ncbi:HAD-like domain-containing protein [Syncephalastrum racemosum]|uniref:HAD-like domain-containing protein n=1 Tax=Syncephalastrum racemosum TaxID=13706 RepID=A0A1X2HR47_SYNRA|nr:HAD-like domain-containing protein [Syncephalastrum racemosum]
MTVKAVIFDIGGVCVGSPMAGIHRYEKEKGLPRNYINVAIVRQGENGAFQKFERGQIKLHDFYRAFGEQLSHPSNKEGYKEYLRRTGKSVPEHIPEVTVDGKELFRIMMQETKRVDPHVLAAIEKIKASGRFTVAALTNNFEMPEDDLEEVEALGGQKPERLMLQFDHYIESRLVGLRKPDPKFYLHACKVIGIEPHEAVFLDDIGMNLRAAQKLGMKTIQVKMGRSEEAVEQLEKIVGLPLLSSKL